MEQKNLYKRITRDRWEIGFVQGGMASVMGNEPLHIHWLKHPYRDRWFADPFILDVSKSEIFVLVEEYRYKTAKGRIALLIVDKSTYQLKSLDIVLELETHLSFPAIWRENGSVFVYPESCQSGELSLYEYKGRYRGLVLNKVLCHESMADAVMTNLFGGRKLFSTQENDKLRIYDLDPVTGCFELSCEKPFGKATARNAGDFFEYAGKVYRPAQVCVERYGEAVEIQEVVWDGEGDLGFVPYKTLYPSHPSLNIGLHTLNSFKGMAVVDVRGWKHPLAAKFIIALKKMFL